MGKFKVTDKDRGYKKLVERIAKQGRTLVTVGIHETEGSRTSGKGPLTVSDVGTIHEFGGGNSPQRSFLRGWADENEEKNKEVIRKIAAAVVSGKLASGDQGLERFGLYAVGGIQKRISDRIPPPNAPSTIKRKGSSVPLINTGQLRSSITHKLVKADK